MRPREKGVETEDGQRPRGLCWTGEGCGGDHEVRKSGGEGKEERRVEVSWSGGQKGARREMSQEREGEKRGEANEQQQQKDIRRVLQHAIPSASQ